MRMLSRATLAVLLLASGIAAAIAPAAAPYRGPDSTLGSISGTVRFVETAPVILPIASISVFGPWGGLVAVGSSDAADGTFSIEAVESGVYDVRFEAPGYGEVTLSEIVVIAPNDTDVGIVELVPGRSSPFRVMQVFGDASGSGVAAPPANTPADTSPRTS